MADDRPQDERFLDLRDHEAALAYLRTCRGDSDSGMQMRGLLADEDAPAGLSELEDDEVLDALAWRIARGDLTPTIRQRVYRSADLIVMPEPSDDEPVLAATKETTWIEIELVDEEGGAVPYESYEITAPDEATTFGGHLDQNGRARHSIPGESGETCQITFPHLDFRAWERI